MYGADPRLAGLGTKSGCRKLFEEVGHTRIRWGPRICTTSRTFRRDRAHAQQRPTMSQVIVKLDEGVSGDGNGLVDLRGLPAPGEADERREVLERVAKLQLESPDVPRDVYLAKLYSGWHRRRADRRR